MSEDDVAQIVNEVVALFVDNNHGNACLIASAVLNELLIRKGIQSKIKEGYGHAEYQEYKVCVLHYWVEIKREAYIDIGRLISIHYDDNGLLRYCRQWCSEEIRDSELIIGEDNENLKKMYKWLQTHSMNDYLTLSHIPKFLKEYWMRKTKNLKNRSKKARKKAAFRRCESVANL